MDEIVMYIILRTDLHMSPGKAGAQIGHAVHLAIREAERARIGGESGWLDTWERGSYPKIILAARSENELIGIFQELEKDDISAVFVVDEGRTEIKPGKTAIGVVPNPKSRASKILGGLPLYR